MFHSLTGCNPKPKNVEGIQPKNLAKEKGHKEASKECRKGEKVFGKTGKNNEPWKLKIYDFCCTKQDVLRELFGKMDTEVSGRVDRSDFTDILESVGAPMPEEEDMHRLMESYSQARDGPVAYEEFLAAKKHVNKQYLMSAFEGKKKKKKGGKGGKKGKGKIPFEICTNADGERAGDGGPPPIYIPRHIHYTDTGRFDRLVSFNIGDLSRIPNVRPKSAPQNVLIHLYQ